MKTPRPSRARFAASVIPLASVMCVILWTQWVISRGLLPASPKALLAATGIARRGTQAAVAAAATANSVAFPKYPKGFIATNDTSGAVPRVLAAAAETTGAKRVPVAPAAAAAAATAATLAPPRRLFTDVDPGRCGELALRYYHGPRHDSSEAGVTVWRDM